MRNILITDHIPGHWRGLLAQVAKSCFWGFFFKNIQPSKLIKHAKKEEELRSRNKSILSRDKTSYPDIPPRLAMCPGPEGPDRPLSPPGREERVCKHSLLGSFWKCWGKAGLFRVLGLAPPSLGAPPTMGGSWPIPSHLACSRPAVPASTMPGQARSWCSSSL